jgi:hypothetical protein
MPLKRVQVYDMDGTIVDSTHRYRTVMKDGKEAIDLEYWRANEFRAYDDDLLPLADQYKRDLADPDCYVIIATARVLNAPDMAFIRDKLGMPDYIVSRKNGDNISGGKLKVKGLKKFFNLPAFKRAAWCFYEDNLTYLSYVCDALCIEGVFVQSNQGH